MGTYRFRTYNADWDQDSDDQLFTTYRDAEAYAIENADYYAHSYIICEHGHAGNCPHDCHTDSSAPTAWTVCPRCQTQIALDDYQEVAGMCDACIIDTTPEPDDVPKLCPRCFRKLGQAPHCPFCREHRDMGLTDEHAPEDHVTPEEVDRVRRRVQEQIDKERDERATWSRMDRGYAKAQYVARAGAVALALTLALGIGSAAAKLSPAQANHVYDAVAPYLPVGCAITHLSEDMGASAVCAGGYVVILDAQPGHKHTDIPFAIGTRVIGPDSSGKYWDWAIHD